MRVITRWDEELTTEESNGTLLQIAYEYTKRVVDPELRHALETAIGSSDYYTLVHLDLDYTRLSCADAISARQALALFQKRSDLDIGIDKRATAVTKFLDAEEQCRQTNVRFRLWQRGAFQFRPRVESVIHGAQRKISSILGEPPALSDIKLHFGPGATTQVKKRDASARKKLGTALSCSVEFLSVIERSLEELQGLFLGLPEDSTSQVTVEIHCGRLDFVRKNAKTDRSIIVGPLLNGLFQLGYGDYIARRLRHSGVDIRDQSKNQRLARVGSLTGALATLDLVSASDMKAFKLIEHLLSPDWYDAIAPYRTSEVLFEEKVLKLQKFSSMGDGYTFPVETLIFYGLAYAACCDVLGRPPKEEEISVYGDDIIVPVSVYPLLTEVLHCVGFKVNLEKSYFSGPFRESCGKDYYSGIDIRPVYVKKQLNGEDIFRLHNFFVRNYEGPEILNPLLDLIPHHLRLYGPDGYGDGHLLGDWVPVAHRRNADKAWDVSKARPPKDWRHPGYGQGWSGYTFETFTWKGRRSTRPSPGDVVLPCYTIYVSPPQEGLPGLTGANFYMIGRRMRRSGYVQPRTDVRYHHDSASVGYSYDEQGRLSVPIPGKKGYKRISIYTLTPR